MLHNILLKKYKVKINWVQIPVHCNHGSGSVFILNAGSVRNRKNWTIKVMINMKKYISHISTDLKIDIVCRVDYDSSRLQQMGQTFLTGTGTGTSKCLHLKLDTGWFRKGMKVSILILLIKVKNFRCERQWEREKQIDLVHQKN